MDDPDARLLAVEEDDDLEETPQESGCVRRRCWMAYQLCIVVSQCAFPMGDMVTDAAIALPLFWNEGYKVDFGVQLASMLAGSIMGAIGVVRGLDMVNKLRGMPGMPEWLIVLMVMALVVMFPASPIVVSLTALYAWFAGAKGVMDNCVAAVVWVATAELLEGLVSLLLQSTSMLYHQLDMTGSIVLSIASVARTATQFETKAQVYSSLTAMKLTTEQAEVYTSHAALAGPLVGFRDPRAFLVFLFRYAEITASTARIALFQYATRDIIAVNGSGVGAATLCVVEMVLQWIMVRITGYGASGLAAPFECVWPIFVPRPLLDKSGSVVFFYVMSALMNLATLACIMMLDHSLRQTFYGRVLLIATACQWSLFILMRCCATEHYAIGAVETEVQARELATVINGGARIRLPKWSPAEQGHPQVINFCSKLANMVHAFKHCATVRDEWCTFTKLPLRITSAELYILSTACQMKRCMLTLSNTGAQDDDVKTLLKLLNPRSQIRDLTVNLQQCNQVTDASIETLAKTMPRAIVNLALILDSTEITDSGLKALAKALPERLSRLELNMWGCRRITDDGAEALAKALHSRIKHLIVDLNCAQNVTEFGKTTLRRQASTLGIKQIQIID